jgi:Copper amine oxidase, enzyme domain
MKLCLYGFLFVALCGTLSCNNSATSNVIKYDDDVLTSMISDADSLKTFDFVNNRVEQIKQAMQGTNPVLLCGDSLNPQQKLAEQIALKDLNFLKNIRDAKTQLPYRNEIFGVLPARESDMTGTKGIVNIADCYKVEMYNYPLNLTTIALVNAKEQKVLAVTTQEQAQPEIPLYLKNLAIKIAVNSPEVQNAYGIKPNEADALMANTKTALNRTRCERSRHLCVAPTFVKEGKALWAIVDLTDYKLVGVRWTNTGTTGQVTPITERKLQDDKLTACFCEKETALEKEGWKMNYMLTSSDGLRISQVSFNGKPILQSAKLVDWHVSYSGTDGFGYSDAVGCPYFSQAAVIAFEPPKILQLKDDAGNINGFVLEQVFKSELWPSPCNYNYRQRFEFYKDGRFRVAAASIGRGCGNDGTYRPVFRIAFASQQNNFAEWNGTDWGSWASEKWQLQSAITKYTPEKYQYKILDNTGSGFFVQPGTGNFNDAGRGDNAFTFITENIAAKDEGESDLVTIGPCCNTDYQQGPEKFIGTSPDNIQNKKLVMWYVPQLKNDNTKGREYCWAESVLENGVYVTKSYPCFAGPMFIPNGK